MVDHVAARALLVTDAQEILLMHVDDEDGLRWITPGGGVEPGEDLADALRREVFEETGHVLESDSPVVWRRRKPTRDGGSRTEHFHLCRVARFEPATDGFTEEEAATVLELRWWTLEELDATDATTFPSGLASHLRVLLTGGSPDEPIDVGD